MNLIGDSSTTELGYLLILGGTSLLVLVFALQTVVLSRRLRQHEAHSRQMEEMAYFDPLTQLPNRRLLFDRLQQALHHAERQNTNAAVFFIDLDNFKEVNDRFGHSLGDQVLASLARLWSNELRAIDTLARWGGDEFVVAIDGIASTADIQAVMERLQRAIAAPLQVGEHEVTIRMSVGVAVGSEGGESPEGLIRCADSAMYRAKRSDADGAYEIVGRPECLTRIAGLDFVPRLPRVETEYVRVTA